MPKDTLSEERFHVIDGVMQEEEIRFLYDRLTSSPGWSLGGVSRAQKASGRQFGSFPSFLVSKGECQDPFFHGYFASLSHRVRRELKRKHDLSIPTRQIRIQVSAMKADSITGVHKDHSSKTAWTLVGYLNPVWDPADGGELMVGETKIEVKPGRFVAFPSNTDHIGMRVTNPNLEDWRLSLNYIFDLPEKALR